MFAIACAISTYPPGPARYSSSSKPRAIQSRQRRMSQPPCIWMFFNRKLTPPPQSLIEAKASSKPSLCTRYRPPHSPLGVAVDAPQNISSSNRRRCGRRDRVRGPSSAWRLLTSRYPTYPTRAAYQTYQTRLWRHKNPLVASNGRNCRPRKCFGKPSDTGSIETPASNQRARGLDPLP
jgi:hypothetical protein